MFSIKLSFTLKANSFIDIPGYADDPTVLVKLINELLSFFLSSLISHYLNLSSGKSRPKVSRNEKVITNTKDMH